MIGAANAGWRSFFEKTLNGISPVQHDVQEVPHDVARRDCTIRGFLDF